MTKETTLSKAVSGIGTDFTLHTHDATKRGRLRFISRTVEPTVAENNFSFLPPAGTRHLQQPERESPR